MLEKIQKAFLDGVVHRDAASLARWSDVDPPWRIQVYQRNHHQSLQTTLQHIFSFTQRLLGGQRFKRLSQAYIDAYPSTCSDLNAYGQQVPVFMEQYLKDTELSDTLGHLPEVARLDVLLHRAYYAPNAPEWSGPSLTQLPTTSQMQQRFQRNPSVLLLQSHWPLDRLHDTCNRHDDHWQRQIEPNHVVVHRQEGKPRFVGVSKRRFDLLQLLASPHSLEALCADHPDLANEFLDTYALGWVHQRT